MQMSITWRLLLLVLHTILQNEHMRTSVEALKTSFREQEARKTGNTDFYPIFQALFYKYSQDGDPNRIFSVISCVYCPMIETDIISPGHTVETVSSEVTSLPFADRLFLEDVIPIHLITRQELLEYLDNTPYRKVIEAMKRFMADYALLDSGTGKYRYGFAFEALEYEEERNKFYEDLLSYAY